MQSAQPQINSNANNNNNVAGPVPSQRRWVPPSRDRRAGGDLRVPPKTSQSSPTGNCYYYYDAYFDITIQQAYLIKHKISSF